MRICRPARRTSRRTITRRSVPDDRRPDLIRASEGTAAVDAGYARRRQRTRAATRNDDSGIRMHTPTIAAGEPNRVYVGWIDGGWYILDTTDKAHPKSSHIFLAVTGRRFRAYRAGDPSRHLAIQTEEAIGTNCKDWPSATGSGTSVTRRHRSRSRSCHHRRFRCVMQSRRTLRCAQYSSESPGCHRRAFDENRGRQLLQRWRPRLLDRGPAMRRWRSVIWWMRRRQATRAHDPDQRRVRG